MTKTVALVAGVCAVLMGCKEEGVRAYRAPKQPVAAAPSPSAPVAPTGAPGSPSAPAPSPGGQVLWMTPPGWEQLKGEQSMRVATFKTGEGTPEVAVSAFAGESGGLLANVNRWRGQLGLAPVDDAELAKTSETTIVEGVRVTLVDLTGTGGQEMLGAVVAPGDGQTWFVKATGEPGAVAKVKPAFWQFARSFRMFSGVTPAPASGGDVQARLSAFKPPSNWTADAKASVVVAAAYDASNGEGGARVTVTMLRNDGGGVVANINRWRDQLGLAPVAKIEDQPRTDLGGGNVQVDLASADGARRMMAAIVTSNGESWFFKITGSPKGVEAEKGAFDALVRGVGVGAK